MIDIGGGSTELVVGRRGEVSFHVSTQVGVVRHTERHLHPTRRRPRARRAARDAGPRFEAAVPAEQRQSVRSAIAVAGTADAVRRDRPRARPLRPRSDRGPPAGPRHAASGCCTGSHRAVGGAQVSSRTGPPGPPPSWPGWSYCARRSVRSGSRRPGYRSETSSGCRAGHRRTRSRHIAQPRK